MLERFRKYVLPFLDTISRIDTSLQILSFLGFDWKSWAILVFWGIINFYQANMTPAESGITIAFTAILACAGIGLIEYKRRHWPKYSPYDRTVADPQKPPVPSKAAQLLQRIQEAESSSKGKVISSADDSATFPRQPEIKSDVQPASVAIDPPPVRRGFGLRDEIARAMLGRDAFYQDLRDGIKEGHERSSINIEFNGRTSSFYQAEYFDQNGPHGMNRGTDLYRIAILPAAHSRQMLKNVSVEVIQIETLPGGFKGLPLPLHFMHNDSEPFLRQIDIPCGRRQFVNVISLDFSKKVFWLHHTVRDFTTFLPLGSYTLHIQVTANNAKPVSKHYRICYRDGSLEMQEDNREESNHIDVAPEYLRGLFKKELTNLQIQNLMQSYQGKWMKVSGQVGDVADYSNNSSPFIRIYFEEKHPRYLRLNFKRADWFNNLSVLKRGDRITILGQIKIVHSERLELENCELMTQSNPDTPTAPSR